MVSLSMMARLLEAVRPDARLILVGDPKQLASVEAGAVLGDLVGPAADALRMRQPARSRLAEVAQQTVPATEPPAGVAIGDGIVVLRRVHRFAGAIADLAEAVRGGDAEAALGILRAGHDDVRWIEVDVAERDAREALRPVRDAAVAAGRRIVEAARAGDAAAAMAALGSFRLLCAHRRGPYGVATWNAVIESWLADELDRFAEDAWYVGRPLLVTQNDYGLRLYNGDTGVIVAREAGRKTAVFERQGELVEITPTRLDAVDTVHALTIHKSQGSQVDAAAVTPRPDLTDPDQGTDVHRGDAGAELDDRLRDRGSDSRGTSTADRARVWSRATAMGIAALAPRSPGETARRQRSLLSPFGFASDAPTALLASFLGCLDLCTSRLLPVRLKAALWGRKGGTIATHLAARLVWHDRGWDGRICNAPKENGWCIRYEWVREGRRDDDEAKRHGKPVATELLPPCIHDANVFGKSSYTFQHSDPLYRRFLSQPPRRCSRTRSCCPFRVMREESGWVYDPEEQRELLSGFFDALEKKHSLVFFYGMHGNPVDDESDRVLFGVGRITDIEDQQYFGGKVPDGRRYPIWWRKITHAGDAEGVRLPYQEYLHADPSGDTATRILCRIPESARSGVLLCRRARPRRHRDRGARAA